ncbi:MAG TPA: trypsin-like peptidase domain-containing protein [Anaerolineales bacterium]|nr:trypsin-like peptidase domain-containing protein [Anaerolineales bacterium]
MRVKIVKPFLWLTTFILVVGLACSVGGSGTDTPPATKEPSQPQKTQPPETQPVEPATQVPEPEKPAGGAVSSLDDVKSAAIQIEAQGTFVNPDFTVSFNSAGYGSGFIIDPSGLAITNNHVVTGAGLFKVWIGGDTTETYNAKVLGVSECSDLAIIDIAGEGFPYLDWHEGPIQVGLEVYAAGFPLGEPQFSLTKGIVSKERAAGETSWASVDYVIEHDATINPGNSGGPLVDENGKVVGINYRGRDTGQFFAIGRDLAQQVVAELKEGKDLETFGVNGEAFAGDNFSGIWVYSVASGSPADKAGLTGGDIITTLEDLLLGTDGSMADYCDILRSHNPGDTLDIEVLRYFTSEILVGQINGRELQTASTFDPGAGVDTGGDTGGTTDVYSGYTTYQDNFGAIQISVPNEWTDVDGSNWMDGDTVIGSGISASASLDNFYNTWTESGVFFGASDDLATLGGYVNLLDVRRDYYIQYCKLRERGDYGDAFYRGKYDEYYNCENTGNVFVVLTAVPRDNSNAFLILVEMQIAKEADRDALTKILESFQVIGSLP